MFFHPGFRARYGERAGGFEHHARVFEYILDCRAHLVGIGEHHLVDQRLAQAEGFTSNLLHRHAVGKKPDVVELHALPRVQRARHRGGVHRLDPDDADLRVDVLDVRGDAGNETAAAHRHEHRVDRLGMLPQDFHADRALAGDHVPIIVGMDEREPALRLDLEGLPVRLGIGVAMEHDVRAARGDRVDLDARRGNGHHDHRATA